jgi:DNA invertase Pin-like site-specific DNA recombinase
MPAKPQVAIYTRVSTDDQDPTRQLDELTEYANKHYPDHTVVPFNDIISGTSDPGGSGYQDLRDEIEAGAIDAVVLDELSRLSRLGGGAIHEFIQLCLEHDTSVQDREVGLSIDTDDSMVDQAVSQMIANIMGDLARIEHKQKLRRIRSGIAAAQDAGKWTGRPPRGFTVEDSRLRVDTEEFLRTRAAVERVVIAGESRRAVADDVGIPESTLKTICNERSELYLHGQSPDDRVENAVAELQPLPDVTGQKPDANLDEFETRVREIVRDELNQ